MTLTHLLAYFLIAFPFLVITIGLVVTEGVDGAIIIWGVALGFFACVGLPFYGVYLLKGLTP